MCGFTFTFKFKISESRHEIFTRNNGILTDWISVLCFVVELFPFGFEPPGGMERGLNLRSLKIPWEDHVAEVIVDYLNYFELLLDLAQRQHKRLFIRGSNQIKPIHGQITPTDTHEIRLNSSIEKFIVNDYGLKFNKNRNNKNVHSFACIRWICSETRHFFIHEAQ